MMQIEIAKLGRMSQTGSSLMTLYQDKHTPILDLLVRESIQNCLDAGNKVNENAQNEKYVDVSFLTGDFCPNDFNKILEGSTDTLNNRYPMSSARYIAIRDKYTEGLTGPMQMSKVSNYQYGNLLKLVYDICKPQENAGAGGSWGIGKTIYFRVGIGIVVYYSRIWDDENNKFSSRFAISIVENERSDNAIIPKSGSSSNTGIAWWGCRVNDNETVPVVNEIEIKGYLDIFKIEPFKENETGTMVIVPYIDEKALLENNRVEVEEDETNDNNVNHIVPTWMHSIEDYLSISVQRWYFPRLNNPKYKFGKYLKLFINGKMVGKSDMQPIFLHWQNLYNSAITGEVCCDTDYVQEIDIKTKKIELRKYSDDTCAGYVAFAKVDRNLLGMTPPDNLYSPYVYIDVEESNGDTNRPLIAYCRMPGMVVSYKNNEEWLKSVLYSEKDKFIIALFALNSKNTFKESGQTLEEYVRKSEMADHTSWNDYAISGNKYDIISKIKQQTSRKIAREFESQYEEIRERRDSGWGQIVAGLLLPSEGFGTRSSRKNTSQPRLKYESHKSLKLALSEEDTYFDGNEMGFTYFIESIKRQQNFNLNLFISTESKSISLSEWEKDGLEIPFEVSSICVRLDKLDSEQLLQIWKMSDEDDNIIDNLITITKNKTERGLIYGLNAKFDEPHSFKMQVTFVVKINSRNVKPLLKPE